MGAYTTTSVGVGVQGAVELNIPMDIFADDQSSIEGIYNAIDVGVSAGIPLQLGTIGAGFGVYGEFSWTEMLGQGNIPEMVDFMIKEIDTKFGIEMSTEQKQTIEQFIDTQRINESEDCDDECNE